MRKKVRKQRPLEGEGAPQQYSQAPEQQSDLHSSAPNFTEEEEVVAANAAAPSKRRQQTMPSNSQDDFFARQQEANQHAQDGETLLYTRGLKKVYDGRAVVNGVDIEVKRGEIVGLLGPNGAGKTTSFYMIVGLVQPNGGQVFFNGLDTTAEPMYKRARLGMGYLPQEESIFRKLTVRENILAVMETQNFTPHERATSASSSWRSSASTMWRTIWP